MRSHRRTWLLAKDVRELLASRAYWVLLLAAGLLAGHAFLAGVDAYAEMSGSGGGPAALAQGLSPLEGIVVPVFGTLSLAAMLLLPFVVIRLIAHEKQTGAWKLLVQGPASVGALLTSKIVVLVAAWLLAWTPAFAALLLWRVAGNHLDGAETLSVLVGHLLFAWLTIGVAAAAAAIMDGEANAAIVALSFTIGTWALEFVGVARGGLFATLAKFTPGAMVRSFEQGLVRSDAAAISLIVGFAGLAIAGTWLRLGKTRQRQWLETIIIMLVAILLSLPAARLRSAWDLSEDRRNSFAPADEFALRSIHETLRVEVHLAPEDPRLEDFRRGVLDKLQRVLPDMETSYIARTTTGLFEQTDSLYGTISYQLGSRRATSRSVTAPIVLEVLYELAAITPPAPATATYPGYPLVNRPRGIAELFFAGWPLLLLAAVGMRRRIRRNGIR